MDPKTGNIHRFADAVTLKAAVRDGFVPISEEDLARVRKMNRKQRRAWAAKQRARRAGPSDA